MAKKGIQTNGSNTGDQNSYFNPADFTIPTGTPTVPQNPVPDIPTQIPSASPAPQPTDYPAQGGGSAANAESVEGNSGGKYDGLPELYITLLGGTSSGKSSFMAGFVQSLVRQTKTINTQQGGTLRLSMKLIEFRSSDSLMTISGSDSAQAVVDAARLGQIIESLSFYWDKQTMRFPEGTTGNSKSYTFVVRVNGTPVATLTVMDYMGGYIDSPDQHKDEMRELGVSCALSHGVIIMADAEKIVGSMIGGEIQTEKAHFDLNAAQINQLMFTISENAKHPVTTVFAITKSDLPAVRAKTNFCANNFQHAAKLLADIIYNGAFDDLSCRKDWWHAIVPVSAVGQNKVDVHNNFLQNAIIRQENIDTTVLFCIYSQLSLLIAQQEETLRQTKRRRYELRALFTTRRDRLARKEAHILAQKQLDELRHLQNVLSARISDFQSVMPLVYMYGIGGIGRVEKGPQS